MPPPCHGGALPDELRDTDACPGPLGASRTPNTLSRLLGLNEATLPGFVHEGKLVVGQGIEPCRRSPSGRSPGLIGPSRTPVLPTDPWWSPAQGSNLLPLDYRSNAHPYELAGAQTVVPAPRLELGYLSVPAFETGASAASARRAHALGARSGVRRPDGVSADFTTRTNAGCDGGARSHTFGLMRTALLPLKLRRKRRRCTRLDSNERLRSFNPPLLPPQLRVQDLELPVGFEPTISRLQGGCIGQLCYGSGRTPEYWSGQRNSNPRPRPWHGRALPPELCPQIVVATPHGFEPRTAVLETAVFP